MKYIRVPLFLLLLSASNLASWGFEQNGGGFTAAGLQGEYFPNATFAGAPAFTRQDVRIDFDWGEKAPIGGSNTPAYRNFPRGAFSVRWTGGVIPRYSEKYTFRIKGGPCQLWVDDKLVIDRHGSSTEEAASEPVSMTMGKTESIKLEYARSEPGQAGVSLEWSSASTPLAVIDPVSVTGFNGESSNFSSDVLTSFFPVITAGGTQDANGNTVRSGAPQFDKDGNPTGDFVTDPTYGTTSHPGTWLLQFSGQAQVRLQFGTPMTALDGTAYPDHVVPKADPHAYNAAMNTTSILMAFKAGNYDYLFIGKTQRLASGAPDATGNAAGLTNLKLIRPAAPEATTPYSGDNLFYGPEEPLVRRFTNLRWIDGMLDESTSWSMRLLPSAGHLSNTYTETGPGAGANSKYCWEYLVMLSNETGKDLYLTLPVVADDEYLTNLAHLIRYGSDGVKPYTSEKEWPAAGPVYPPLNSNLRVIFEMGNETWNGSGPYNQQRQAVEAVAKAAIAQGSADAVINYDGKAANDDALRNRRFLARRVLVASNIFRSVFEPSNTTTQMTRIRPIFEYQYTNIASAQPAFDFIDDVYAKADPASPNKEAAHPVSYYFWGGGAATYFGSANEIGLQSEVALADPDFETPDVAPGVAQDAPKGSAWNFVSNATGAAGIYHNSVRSKLAVASLGAASHEPQAVGCEFTVGPGDICVYQIGRYVKTPAANDTRRDLHIYRVSDNAEVYSGQVSMRGATAGLHVVRVQDASGAFAINGLSVTVVNAPVAPELKTATDGSSSVALSWDPATSGPEAKGYDVYFGTATGQNSTCVDVGNVTNFTVTGLQDKSPYFFVVRAYDDAGPSLPSNEKVGVPLSDGVVGSLLSWELEKNTGAEDTVEPTSVTSRATASAISRGPGLRPSTYGPGYVGRGYGLSSKDSGPPFGATLADAIAAQQYVEFTFMPKPGKIFSLKSLAVRAFMQGSEGANVGLTYSTDGTQFSSGLAATGGPPDAMTGNEFDLDLSGSGDLQAVTGKIVFRIYLFGPKIGQYGFNGLGKGPGNDIDLTGSFSSKP